MVVLNNDVDDVQHMHVEVGSNGAIARLIIPGRILAHQEGIEEHLGRLPEGHTVVLANVRLFFFDIPPKDDATEFEFDVHVRQYS